MPPRPHLRFRNPVEDVQGFRYSNRDMSGVASKNNQARPEAYFRPFIRGMEAAYRQYHIDFEDRVNERNPLLKIPATISCIEILFQDRFDAADFEEYYRRQYGLSAVVYKTYHREALFSVVDEGRFTTFLAQVDTATKCEDHNNPDYDTQIRFIKSFRLLTSAQIRQRADPARKIAYLSLVDTAEIYKSRILPIFQNLTEYLNSKSIAFEYNNLNNTIELLSVREPVLIEIAQNFDIVHSINTTNVGVRIRPGIGGQVVREPKFYITNAHEELPIVGIIDTGVSNETPLSSLLIDAGNNFDVTGGKGVIDNVDHGTGVASLAALGSRLVGQIPEALEADAKILSIKVLDSCKGSLANHTVINYIQDAYKLGVRLFVLTICYEDHLKCDEMISDYAYALDLLAFELDILICISTGNRDHDVSECVKSYPRHFGEESSNMKSPAESMNNMTVGAIGDNLEAVPIQAMDWPVHDAALPALYSRKFHLSPSAKEVFRNKHVSKPDVLFSGGNYLEINHPFFGLTHDSTGRSGIQFFSSDFKKFGLLRDAGTSYSAPLVANIAAKILRKFPELRMQTVKALIINSSENVATLPNEGISAREIQFISGFGTPSVQKCLFSDDNEVCMIIEDDIDLGNAKSFKLRLPEYLTGCRKDAALLKIEATLCFSFPPIQNNQLSYCPVNLAFGVFKNLPLQRQHRVSNGNGGTRLVDTGIIANTKDKVALSSTAYWSQDGYGKGKLLSNVQKVAINISRTNIVDENQEFKIAIGCRAHSNLVPSLELPKNLRYSLVIRIRENLKAGDLTGKLYDELVLTNDLVVMGDLDAELNL